MRRIRWGWHAMHCVQRKFGRGRTDRGSNVRLEEEEMEWRLGLSLELGLDRRSRAWRKLSEGAAVAVSGARRNARRLSFGAV
jgi:hypothetical protein